MKNKALMATVTSAALIAAPATAAFAAGPHGRGGGGGGTGVNLTTCSATLTAKNTQIMQDMAEEEKVAHDVYVALSEQYPEAVQFSRIAKSEAKHLEAVRKLMTCYSIDDPTLGLAEGEFASPEFQAMYDDLVASATTVDKALEVGVAIEKEDIADLKDARAAVKAKKVKKVYTNLLRASKKHLAAFSR